MSQHQSLLATALRGFPNLTEAERRLLIGASISVGEVVHCDGPTDVIGQDNDGQDLVIAAPPNDDRWKPQHVVHSSLLRWLCVDPAASQLIDPYGIDLRNARIAGLLDLASVQVIFRLRFIQCLFDGSLLLSELIAPSLEMMDCMMGRVSATNAHVRGDTAFRHCIIVGGTGDRPTMDLTTARIDGDLILSRSVLGTGGGGAALSAAGTQIGGTLFLNNGFMTQGDVTLLGSEVKGSLSFRGAGFFPREINTAVDEHQVEPGESIDESVPPIGAQQLVDLERVSVGGSLTWDSVQVHDQLSIDLTGARAGAFVTDDSSWPTSPGSVKNDGFIYERIIPIPAASDQLRQWTSDRIDWIQLQPQFAAQPYEQLISTLRRLGYEIEARRVAIAKQDDLRKNGDLPAASRVWRTLLYHFMRYGYEPLRAVQWSIGVVIIGVLLFAIGNRTGDMVKTDTYVAPSSFYSIIYSIDTFLPVIDLEWQQQWRPSGAGFWGWSLLVWYWTEISLGWLMSSVFALGLTGFVRKD